MAQKLGGRRGSVFAMRVTDEERAQLEELHAALGGPRALGAWILWRALHSPAPVVPGPGNTRSSEDLAADLAAATMDLFPGVVPRRRGSAGPGPGRVVPGRSRGTTRSSEPPVGERVILDLCAGSGSWSEPYAAAGYHVVRVTLPEADVRTFKPPARVWGILAAPPCDQFSLARNGHAKPRDLLRGMETVAACMRIVLQARPRWWALENPVGLLSRYLGTPRDVFEPCDFGDPWTKRTALWGSFAIPARGPFVEPLGGGPLCVECDPERRKTTWCNRADHRARTAPGFARAFLAANP